jgi:hypothetical protein
MDGGMADAPNAVSTCRDLHAFSAIRLKRKDSLSIAAAFFRGGRCRKAAFRVVAFPAAFVGTPAARP